VLYTSGSTGRPKGVAIAQRSAVALIQWARTVWSARELAAVLAATSINFDLSVFELFVPLTSGGAAFLVENALAVAGAATELLCLHALPAAVETINLAGEPLRQELVRELLQVPGIARVFDLYGPSEDTTYSTFAQRSAEGPETIGRPIAGTCAYVLDRWLRLVPSGVVGELCLGGRGLARGYLHRPGLSAEKFVPEPFSGRSGERLYRTGDRVRWSGGALQFLGRFDHQVKVRGFRIELGEIEVRLLAHPQIADGVVVVRNRGSEADIVAYGVAVHSTAPLTRPSVSELLHHLRQTLPEYMVPAHLVLLAELPRLPNGKVDRKALPAPQLAPETSGERAQTPTEATVAAIWSEVLGIPEPGRDDNFLSLGGHSLSAMQVIARLRARLAVELPVHSIFSSPTVRALARTIDELAPAPATRRWPTPAPAVGALRASFAQERLWFLDQLLVRRQVYNLPWPLGLTGPLVVPVVGASLHEIARRHAVLRTTFRQEAGVPIQVVQPWSTSCRSST
jgi:acyl carrier protein